MLDSWKIWRTENKEKREKERNNVKNKNKNRFKIDKLFLYISLNSFYLSFIYIKIK